MRRLKAKKRQELLPAGYFILLLPYLKQIEIILLIQIFYIKTHLLLIRFEGIIHFSGNMFFGAGKRIWDRFSRLRHRHRHCFSSFLLPHMLLRYHVCSIYFLFFLFFFIKTAHTMNSHSCKYPPEKEGYCLFFHRGPKQQITHQKKDKRYDPDNSQVSLLFKKTKHVKESKKQQRQEIKQLFLIRKASPSYVLGNHVS